MIETALCYELWGGTCQEQVHQPLFECGMGHSARALRLQRSRSENVTGRFGFAANDVYSILRTVSNPYLSDAATLKMLERVTIDGYLARAISTAPNLPFQKFGDCLSFGQIPKRSLEFTLEEMTDLLELAPEVSWLCAFSCNEVSEIIWEVVQELDHELVIGPVPDSAPDANIVKLTSICGDATFHMSLLAEICKRHLPRSIALQAHVASLVGDALEPFAIEESKLMIDRAYKATR